MKGLQYVKKSDISFHKKSLFPLIFKGGFDCSESERILTNICAFSCMKFTSNLVGVTNYKEDFV
jgi:hypothetical protein